MFRSLNSCFIGVALLFSGVGSSCVTNPVAPSDRAPKAERFPTPHAEELGQFVLVLHESAGGLVTHDWQPAESFDRSPYKHRLPTQVAEGGIVLAVARPRDCDEENRTCINECMRTPLPRGFGHTTAGNRGKGGKLEHCEARCRQPYIDCNEAQGRKVHEFSSVDNALDGLKSDLPLIVTGSIVIIAGTVFITVSAGAGLLILVPAALLTAS